MLKFLVFSYVVGQNRTIAFRQSFSYFFFFSNIISNEDYELAIYIYKYCYFRKLLPSYYLYNIKVYFIKRD